MPRQPRRPLLPSPEREFQFETSERTLFYVSLNLCLGEGKAWPFDPHHPSPKQQRETGPERAIEFANSGLCDRHLSYFLHAAIYGADGSQTLNDILTQTK